MQTAGRTTETQDLSCPDGGRLAVNRRASIADEAVPRVQPSFARRHHHHQRARTHAGAKCRRAIHLTSPTHAPSARDAPGASGWKRRIGAGHAGSNFRSTSVPSGTACATTRLRSGMEPPPKGGPDDRDALDRILRDLPQAVLKSERRPSNQRRTASLSCSRLLNIQRCAALDLHQTTLSYSRWSSAPRSSPGQAQERPRAPCAGRSCEQLSSQPPCGQALARQASRQPS